MPDKAKYNNMRNYFKKRKEEKPKCKKCKVNNVSWLYKDKQLCNSCYDNLTGLS